MRSEFAALLRARGLAFADRRREPADEQIKALAAPPSAPGVLLLARCERLIEPGRLGLRRAAPDADARTACARG